MKIILSGLIYIGFLFSDEITTTYLIEGMMCGVSCPKKVNDSLNNIDGIKSCKVDFESKTATVVFDDKILDSKKIASIITKKTYYKVMNSNNKQKSLSLWDWLFGEN